MELLWYGFMVAFCLAAAIYVGLGSRTPRCRDCQMSAIILSRQIAGSSPAILEIVYRCPTCGEILWERLVSTGAAELHCRSRPAAAHLSDRPL